MLCLFVKVWVHDPEQPTASCFLISSRICLLPVFACYLCLQVLHPHCFSELTSEGTTWTRTLLTWLPRVDTVAAYMCLVRRAAHTWCGCTAQSSWQRFARTPCSQNCFLPRNCCLQVLHAHCFSELTSEGTTWTRTLYRAFYRAMYGVANTLRKMGRCACGMWQASMSCFAAHWCDCAHDQGPCTAWPTYCARWAGSSGCACVACGVAVGLLPSVISCRLW
jgi:hypothetical protein